MVTITEGKDSRELKCIFPNGWDAIKYDESDWHRNRMKSHLKAMDILATNDNHHWWIEIKDCEGYESDNRPRLSPKDSVEVDQTRQWVKDQGWDQRVKADRKKPFIVDEMVEKFHHTLMALACAERDECVTLAKYWVICSRKPLSVVLLLTWDSKDFKRLAMRLQDKLRRALSYYAVDAYVINGTPPEAMGLKMTVERV